MTPKSIRLYAVTSRRPHAGRNDGTETRTRLYRTRPAAQRCADRWREMGREVTLHAARVTTWRAA